MRILKTNWINIIGVLIIDLLNIMNKKHVANLISFFVAAFFFLFAIQPGVFTMVGYSISILIFSENSTENIKYGHIVVYAFEILCAVLVFYSVKVIVNRIQKI